MAVWAPELRPFVRGPSAEPSDILLLVVDAVCQFRTVARKNAAGTFEVVGEAEDIGVGERKDLTLQLAKGDYELQCNIVEEVNGKPSRTTRTACTPNSQ